MVSRPALCLLLVVAHLGPLLARAHADPPAISGLVLLPDGQPAAGAVVFYPSRNAGEFEVGQVRTDGAGRFACPQLPPIRSVVGVVLAGYPLTMALVKPGQETTIRLEAKPVALTGTVTDPEGKPLAGAQVGVDFVRSSQAGFLAVNLPCGNAGYLLHAVCDAAGRFSLPDLGAGQEVRMEVVAPRHAEASASATVGQPDLKLVLPPESTISGHVTQEGRGVSGVRLRGNGQTAVTGPDGAYRLEHLGSGETSLYAERTPEGLVAAPRALTVHTGEHLTDQDVALTPGAVVAGTVTAADTGRPVASAWVTAEMRRAGKWAGSYGVATGADGTFRLRVSAGDCELRVSGGSAETAYWEGAPQEVSLQVQEGEQRRGVAFTLRPPSEVRGVVLGPDGHPAAGARVLLAGHLWPRDFPDTETTTDAAGRFRYLLRPGGDHGPGVVLASAPGCALAWASVRPDQEVTIRLGGKPVDLTGRTVDPAGRPVAGVQIRVTELGLDNQSERQGLLSTSPFLTATSGADGTFALPGFPPGLPLTYRVTTPGYADMEGSATAGQADLQLSLAPEAVLEGRVLFDGRPAAGVWVMSYRREEFSDIHRISAITGADGTYRLDHLAAGESSVIADRGDLPAGAVAPLARKYELQSGDHLTGQDILFTRAAVLSGKLTEAASGKPASNQYLTAYFSLASAEAAPNAAGPVGSEESVRTLQATTDATGVYQLKVPAGRYRLSLSVARPPRDSWTLSPASRPVEVTEGGHQTGLDFVLAVPPQLHGRVLLSDGRPAAGVTVFTNQLYVDIGKESTNPWAALTATDGSFAINIDRSQGPGQFPGENQTACVAFRASDNLAGWTPIRDVDQPLEIRLAPGALATGRIVDPQGHPVAGVSFNVNWAEPHERRPLAFVRGRASDAQGRFRIGPLPAGTLEIDTVETDAPYITDAEWNYDGGLQVALQTGQTQELPTMHLDRRGRTASVTVVDLQGQPVPGALVMSQPTFRDDHVNADQHGQVTLTGLPVHGGLWIGVRHPTQPLYDARLVDPDGQPATRFVVRPTGSLSGQVVDGQGQPLAGSRVLALPAPGRPGWDACWIWALVHFLNAAALHQPPRAVSTDEPGATTDEQGKWRIDNLPAGLTYTLELLPQDGDFPLRPDARSFLVESGKVMEVGQVVLKPPPARPLPARGH